MDLTDEPISNPDLILFVDGSSYYQGGRRRTGYAIVNQKQVTEAEPLSERTSAQGEELLALMHAAHLGKGKRVNVYTDSRYAFRACHATGMLWKERGFLTSLGGRVANGKEIQDLTEAIQLPRKIAMMHCPAYTKGKTEISQGNELANAAAKAAALEPWKECVAAIPAQNQNKWPDLTDPKAMYEKDCSVEERKQWEKWEAKQEESGIWTSGGKLILPKKYIVTVARWFHDKTHGGAEAIAEQIRKEATLQQI